MKSRRDLTLQLNDLILNPSSLVRLETNIYHVALHPSSLSDLKSAIKDNLDSLLYKFNSKFGGFLLGYKNVKIVSDRGSLINDDFYIHFNILADFYIFAPKVRCVLYGIVNKKNSDHIGCLVHNYFNVSIPRPAKEHKEEWIGTSVEIGHKVTFELEVCDFTGNLPYMRGSILSSCTVNSDDEALPETKKNKKLKIKELQEDSFAVSESQLEEFSNRIAKRKRENDNENSPKKKKKRKHEDDDDEKHMESNSLHMSSDDPDYGVVLEHIKESYLKENAEDVKEKTVKETMRISKRKIDFQDNLSDIAQNLHSNSVEEYGASKQTENKNKKRKKHHDVGEKPELVLPDLVTLVENYKSSVQKLDESFSISNKGSELNSSSHDMEESSSPSIGRHLLDKTKELADKEPKKKKKKDKVKNDNISSDSQEKVKKKKKKHDDLEKTDIGITRIEAPYKRKYLENSSPIEQSGLLIGREQETEFEEAVITPNVFLEPVKKDKSKNKQISNLHRSLLSRIASVYSDSDNDNSQIPNLSEVSPYNLLKANMVNAQDRKHKKLNKGKGDGIPERKSLPMLPSYTQMTEFSKSNENEMAHNNIFSAYESKKSVTFSDEDMFTPSSDLSSMSLVKTQKSPKNAKAHLIKDSNVITQSPRDNTGTLINSSSPSKSKKHKMQKSPIQEAQALSELNMESETPTKKGKSETDGNFCSFDFSNSLKTLVSKSPISPSCRTLVKTQKSPKNEKSNAKAHLMEDSNVITESPTDNKSPLINSSSPSKSKKHKIQKSPIQETQTLSELSMASKTPTKKGKSETDGTSHGFDLSNSLKVLVSKSLTSPQILKAAKNITNVQDLDVEKSSKKSDISESRGRKNSKKVLTAEAQVGSEKIKKKDKHKSSKKDKKKKKKKMKDGDKEVEKRKTEKKSKNKKNSNSSDIKKLSDELLKKYLKG